MPNNCHHCDEFSRAALLRKSAAQAGRGLPAIEPGMPIPAGTGLDRRSFVSGVFGLALSVYDELIVTARKEPGATVTVLGVGASLALGRYAASLLYEISPRDPGAVTVSAALMMTVALLAALIPARRAMLVDPVVALRQD